MKTLQLFKNGLPLLGSDGILKVDGRYNAASIRAEVLNRNERFKKNFPHKLADSYATYNGRIGGSLSKIVML